MHHLKSIQDYGQSIWLDFIRRSLITSGELKQLVDEGLRGMTSNPSIFHRSIAVSNDYDDAIKAILKSRPQTDTMTLYEQLAIEDIQMAADVFLPVYEGSLHADGFISLEVSPHLADDTVATVAEARRLWRRVHRPNLMIKVPATPAGIPAIEELIAEGINVNITLIFSLANYEAVARAYLRGLARNKKTGRVASVASFFVSRIDTYVDREIDRVGTRGAAALRGTAAIALAKVVYRRFRQIFESADFAAQKERGAALQRLVWGSTSTKDPSYSDVKYVEELIGRDTVNTVPPETLAAFRQHGKLRAALEEGLPEAEKALAALKETGINLDAITEQLQKDGVKAFAEAFDQMLKALELKRQKCLSAIAA